MVSWSAQSETEVRENLLSKDVAPYVHQNHYAFDRSDRSHIRCQMNPLTSYMESKSCTDPEEKYIYIYMHVELN